MANMGAAMLRTPTSQSPRTCLVIHSLSRSGAPRFSSSPYGVYILTSIGTHQPTSIQSPRPTNHLTLPPHRPKWPSQTKSPTSSPSSSSPSERPASKPASQTNTRQTSHTPSPPRCTRSTPTSSGGWASATNSSTRSSLR